jgi:UDP-N-acetylmuramoylalanine--D-glutamate ligase
MQLRESVIEYLKGKRCAVLGLGISNRPLCDFLCDHGAIVTACDRKDASFFICE